MAEPLITLEHVIRTFTVKGQMIKAVDNVNLTIPPGEVVVPGGGIWVRQDNDRQDERGPVDDLVGTYLI